MFLRPFKIATHRRVSTVTKSGLVRWIRNVPRLLTGVQPVSDSVVVKGEMVRLEMGVWIDNVPQPRGMRLDIGGWIRGVSRRIGKFPELNLFYSLGT